jgi:hypothetical protein
MVLVWNSFINKQSCIKFEITFVKQNNNKKQPYFLMSLLNLNFNNKFVYIRIDFWIWEKNEVFQVGIWQRAPNLLFI